jgi:MGT family glycosyltransferase
MFQGGGNIPLIVPIVERLSDLGHDVRVVVGPGIRRDRLPVSASLLESLAAARVQVLSLPEASPHPLADPPPPRDLLFGWTPTAFGALRVPPTSLWAPHWAASVSAELERQPADIVVADFFLVGALAAAEALGVPSIALFHTVHQPPMPGRPPMGPGWPQARGYAGRARDAIGRFASRRLRDRNLLPPLNDARKRLGLGPLRSYDDIYDRAARVVVLASPHFDFLARRLPANVRHVGTPLGEPAAELWSPPWPIDDTRSSVLVSLSTLQQGQATVMERVLSALGTLPVNAVATFGPAMDPQQFDVPANVAAERFVPHAAVLPRVQLMVTQCGLGTLMKGLAHGVPLVCLPVLGDQHDNAARVVALGAGVRLRADASVDAIRDAIDRVATDARYRRAAQAFAEKIKDEDPVGAAAQEILDVA